MTETQFCVAIIKKHCAAVGLEKNDISPIFFRVMPNFEIDNNIDSKEIPPHIALRLYESIVNNYAFNTSIGSLYNLDYDRWFKRFRKILKTEQIDQEDKCSYCYLSPDNSFMNATGYIQTVLVKQKLAALNTAKELFSIIKKANLIGG